MTDDQGVSLASDLALQAGSVSAAQREPNASDRLAALEQEHRVLSDKRRRLHSSIDLLDAAEALKPDVAALLARYRRSERDISWRRRELYRELERLRAEASLSGRETQA